MKRINPTGNRKFLVVKVVDIEEHLTIDEQVVLQDLIGKINLGRSLQNKEINSYLVVNVDESYSFVVSELIMQGEAEKQRIATHAQSIEKGKTRNAVRKTRGKVRGKERPL